MKVLAKNLEILLLQHDLVIVPGLGGFLVDYRQADFDESVNNLMLPPARFLVFNKNLKGNDGLLVHAYMQNYDANYPQAYRQLELDVEELYDQLNEEGWVILDNVGTLRMDINGLVSFEQIHQSLVTPSLFALPTLSVKSVEELEKERDIVRNIELNAELPVEQKEHRLDNQFVRRRWKDIAISSAAAVALFFLFAFPYGNSRQSDRIVAGPAVETQHTSATVQAEMQPMANAEIDKQQNHDNNPQPATVVQPQIILLQAPQNGSDAVVISPDAINNAQNINSEDGKYTIAISYAANEQCADYVINLLEEENIPGAFYYEEGEDKFLLYSRFKSYSDASKTLKALKKVNKRFRRAWVKKLI